MIVLHDFWKTTKQPGGGDRTVGTMSVESKTLAILAGVVTGAVALGVVVGLPVAMQLHLWMISQ